MSTKLFLCLTFFPVITMAAGTQFGPIHFDEENLSPALQAFALLSVLSLAPSILMMLSSFTRIIVVLSMLRNALGLQHVKQRRKLTPCQRPKLTPLCRLN